MNMKRMEEIENNNAVYERIIIYISPEFIEMYQEEQVNLDQCFLNAEQKNSNVLRIPSFQKSRLYSICAELEQSLPSRLFANTLYQKVLFLEFMIHLNRAAIQNKSHYYIETHYSNTKILAVIAYINSNLTTDITIDFLASHFYISKYHLMHTFKEETGYTIGSYLATKRLLYARSLIENGMSVTEACYQSGYRNYSTFYRAYKKLFQQSARNSQTSCPVDTWSAH